MIGHDRQFRRASGRWPWACPGLGVVVLCLLPGVGAAVHDSTPPPDRDDDLGERLIRKAVEDAEEDVMAEIIRLMTESSRRLEIEFDTADETQAVQRQIVSGLDEAIKTAAARVRRTSRDRPPSSGDVRRRPPRIPDAAAGARSDGAATGEAAAGGEPSSSGGQAAEPAGDRALLDTRRGWGNLPPREREEVLQGAGEEYLERFREWIEQYYRSLQEAEE